MQRTCVSVRQALLAVSLVAAFAGAAVAQVRSVDIVGVATDPSGGVLPGVTVTATNLATNDERRMVSDDGGRFAFRLLPVGKYSVKAELSGFRTWSVAEVTLAAGDTLTLDPRLEIGAATETVVVTAEAPVLQRQSSTIMALIDQTAVQDLPLNGRNFVQLAQLAPGASNTTVGFSQGGLDDRRLTSQLSVNGQYSWANNHMIDGMDNNERFIGTIILKPSVESVQEMRMQTNLYTAEIGRTAGGVVNLITKSGTNAYHGSAYDYFRNQSLNTRGYFEKLNNLPKLKDEQLQLGGSIGGPIRKDKLFFFFDYERLELNRGQTGTTTVPTLAQRAGNFGNTRIGDPRTTPAGCVPGSPCVRQQFSNNTIPAERIDPVAANLIQLYPLPTNDSASNNFSTNWDNTTDQNTFDARVDWRISARKFMFVRYSATTLFADVGNVIPDWGNQQTTDQDAYGLQLNFVQTVSDRMTIEYRGGWTRFALASVPLLYGQNISEQFGIQNANVNLLSSGLTNFSPSNLGALGSGGFIPQLNTNDVYQGGVVMTRQQGAHNTKFGIEGRARHLAQAQSSAPRGQFAFTDVLTRIDPFVSGSGNSIASFLLGVPSQVSRNAQTISPNYRFSEFDVFVQDDWRVRRWLTLNFGVRYDYFSPLSERDNQIANFDYDTGRVIVAGENGVSETVNIRKDFSNFAPRIGFAATLNERTVVRGGYGISFIPPFMGTPGALRNPPFVTLFAGPIGSTYIGSDKIATALPPFVPADPNNPSGNIAATGFDGSVPYVHQFNVTVQRELPLGFVGGVSYVGQRGKDQYFPNNGPDFNSPLPGNPQTVQARRPYASTVPNATNIGYYGPLAETTYDAMQATLERRFRNSLGATVNYTLGDARDQYDHYMQVDGKPVLRWGPSNLDIRHRITSTVNFQLPFGKNSTGLVAALVKGWRVDLIGQFQTGNALTVTNNNDVDGQGSLPDYPNMVGNPELAANDRTLNRFFDTSAFATQPVGTVGNAERGVIRGPGFSNLDMSFTKSFAMGSAANVELTLQAFNIFNTFNWGTPNTQLGNTQFGRISTQNGNPRQMQAAVKLTF